MTFSNHFLYVPHVYPIIYVRLFHVYDIGQPFGVGRHSSTRGAWNCFSWLPRLKVVRVNLKRIETQEAIALRRLNARLFVIPFCSVWILTHLPIWLTCGQCQFKVNIKVTWTAVFWFYSNFGFKASKLYSILKWGILWHLYISLVQFPLKMGC